MARLSNEKSQKKIQLSWEDINEAVKHLHRELDSPVWTTVVAVERGGVIPASWLARKLSCPLELMRPEDKLRLCAEGERLLIIDDIYDSGETAERIRKNHPGIGLHFGFIVTKQPTKQWAPIAIPLDHWVVFPWEIDDV